MPRIKMPEADCLIPGCHNKFGGEAGSTGARGMCKTCHMNAMSLIKRGITNWDELEALNLCQPKYGSLVERALMEARKKAVASTNKTEL